ncbi:unnamed protein product, partial [Coregonus sp. 'balchen']
MFDLFKGVSGGPYGVTSDNVSPCALRGSSVVFGCSYDYPSRDTVTKTIWFGMENNTWTDLFQNQAYSGCVEYLGNNMHNCTLRISNLRPSDAKKYHFRFLTDHDKWSDPKGVVLSVTGLHGDNVVYSTVKARQANVTDNLQYASIQFPLPNPIA